MSNPTIAIIGGSSGIGLAVARLALARGDTVIIGGRTQGKLDAAANTLGGKLRTHVVDGTDPASLARFFIEAGQVDHLFTPGASYTVASFREASSEVARSPFENKFWAQYNAVKAALPHLSSDGSVVLMAGAAGQRPVPAGAAYAACNSAIESLGRSLALELAPLRVNTVSPGTIDSDLWRNRPAEMRERAYSGYAAATPVGRVGTVDEVATAVLFLMDNRFMTGSTIHPDGGFVMR